ncbi:MAG: lactate utilization protein [Candidatus Korobacteraceae bacterium]
MDAMFDTFKLRAEAVSAEVHRFPHKSEAMDFIVSRLQSEGIADTPQSYAVWAGCAFLNATDRTRLAATVPGLTFAVTREKAAASKIGISQFDWAMANTGTLVQDAAPVDRRLVSTLPIIHIAVVATGQLLPDLPSILAKIRPEQTNYISFVTGPSRTADIERVLTIGVHGPEKLIIVFVDELAEAN